MQTFLPPKSKSDRTHQVYCYVNHFEHVVVAKVIGFENRHCERVVFPTEKFLFIANDDCELEIHRHMNVGITQDIILCSDLEVVEEQILSN